MKRFLSVLFVLMMLTACLSSFAAADETAVLSVESQLYASAFTTGKSTLKRARGISVSFVEDSAAVMTLSLPSGAKIDDSLIDDSKATVSLIDGDGYYAAEYAFTATSLKGEWKDGQTVYTIADGEFDLDALNHTDDESVKAALSSLRGIGPWTAEMLMIFCMQRPDVVSYGDLAILRGMRMLYRKKESDKASFARYGKRYSPDGTTASLYLWAIAGGAIPELTDPAAPKPKGAKKK